mgnify:CR=1 FL=1
MHFAAVVLVKLDTVASGVTVGLFLADDALRRRDVQPRQQVIDLMNRSLLSGFMALETGRAAGITLLARRLAMGTILVVFAGIAAALPLVTSILTAAPDATASGFTFDKQSDRPSVLWVVSDELQFPLAFDQEGNVRPELPNLKELAAGATTYTTGYSAANYTDYAVPSMLSGISDAAGQGAQLGRQLVQLVRGRLGLAQERQRDQHDAHDGERRPDDVAPEDRPQHVLPPLERAHAVGKQLDDGEHHHQQPDQRHPQRA